MADPFATWEITHGVEPRGKTKIVVNGQDVTNSVRSLRLDLNTSDLASLSLELIGSGTISGKGIVTVYPGETPKACGDDRHYVPPGESTCVCRRFVPAQISEEAQVLR